VSAGPGRWTGLKITGRFSKVPSGGRDLLALSEQVSPGVVLDCNEEGQVVGFEMLSLSKRTPKLDLKHFELQTV